MFGFASSRDGPVTPNEPTSVELLAMLECFVRTLEWCYEEANNTERSYSHIPGNLWLYAN